MPAISIKSVRISLLGGLQSALWRIFSLEPEWGVYEAGKSKVAFQVDSVVAMAQRKTAIVSDYPVESGSFASYNKVERPREIPIELSKGGTEEQRTKFLGWLQTNLRAPTLFDLVMPEQRFVNMTLVDYVIRRDSSSGVTIIYAECVFAEIRQSEARYFKSTQSPNDTATAPTTKVQPVAQ